MAARFTTFRIRTGDLGELAYDDRQRVSCVLARAPLNFMGGLYFSPLGHIDMVWLEQACGNPTQKQGSITHCHLFSEIDRDWSTTVLPHVRVFNGVEIDSSIISISKWLKDEHQLLGVVNANLKWRMTRFHIENSKTRSWCLPDVNKRYLEWSMSRHSPPYVAHDSTILAGW